ncbi:putative glycolipid-binding domain-containing protein [Oerskovia sp. Sa1BUA8]|uniref:Glycolipid-binding domain-containing protein n=1 Tax=Oerskovia douganii TaxID=2762210 RepID=A0A9D5YZF2_9CELL|nr:putative glycolipid-binding domain-containing protein [Oerskovia douganii]MBE7700897.1 putative glycolipid-binding domain-containing protein [Oerskovia douganii]
MTRRYVTWAGEDDPDRLDTAVLSLGADRFECLGTSRSATWVTAWSLTTGPQWVTRRLEVTARGQGWSRDLLLERSGSGEWTARVSHTGAAPVDLATPGIEDPSALAGALDCDLALCPVTNSMPILRLGLLGERAPVEPTPLTMAWVVVPSLRVLRSDQVYAPGAPYDPGAGRAVVTYTSATRDVTADLTVDADGLVIDYPHLARRVR